MLPVAEKTGPASSTAGRRIRRRRNSNNSKNVIGSSVAVLSLLCLTIFAIPSVVNAFTATVTTTSSSIPAVVGKRKVQVHVESSLIRQQKQHLSPRTNSLVLTSTKSAEIDGSAINGGSSSLFTSSQKSSQSISKLSATLSKIGLMAFIISMCLALPVALLPPHLLYRSKLISQVKQQNMALASGQFCARWLLRLIPFCKIKTFASPEKEIDPQPCVWVCNHTSALDIFILLAKDFELRGKRKRPIKIVYVSIKKVEK